MFPVRGDSHVWQGRIPENSAIGHIQGPCPSASVGLTKITETYGSLSTRKSQQQLAHQYETEFGHEAWSREEVWLGLNLSSPPTSK